MSFTTVTKRMHNDMSRTWWQHLKHLLINVLLTTALRHLLTTSKSFMSCHLISFVKGVVLFVQTTADKYPVLKVTVVKIRTGVVKSLRLYKETHSLCLHNEGIISWIITLKKCYRLILKSVVVIQWWNSALSTFTQVKDLNTSSTTVVVCHNWPSIILS